MTKPALDSLQLQFCLVRTRYILPLFCHCSRTIDPIVTLLFSSQLLGLSALCVFLQKEKSVGWNTLASNYIFHLCMTQAKLKTMNKETHQLFKKFCCLPDHVFPASIGTMHIYFYFVLPNNKQMTEQRYILQTISDEHQNSAIIIFMSKSWEVITV